MKFKDEVLGKKKNIVLEKKLVVKERKKKEGKYKFYD